MAAGNDKIFQGMVFRMRPSTSKSRLKKLIETNGGRFIKAGEKSTNIINLTDDEKEKYGIYMDFITVSVQKKKLEPMEKYDLSIPKITSSITQVDASSMAKGRQAYQPEEDDAIIQYVTLHGGEYGKDGSVGGNLLWVQMEKQGITSHTWQSMKSRYHSHLLHRAPSFPYQPLTVRMFGNTTVSYAVSRDSPLNSEEDTSHLVEKKKEKKDSGGRKKTKKLYNADTIPLYDDTPTRGNKSESTGETVESSQHISDVSSTDTSGASTQQLRNKENVEGAINDLQKSQPTSNDINLFESLSCDLSCNVVVCENNVKQQGIATHTEQVNSRPSSNDVDLFESFSGDASCDGIVRQTGIEQQTGENEIQHKEGDNKSKEIVDEEEDDTQSILSSPQENLRLKPQFSSTVSKNVDSPGSTQSHSQKAVVEIPPEFTESDGEGNEDDDFDKQLFAQALQVVSNCENTAHVQKCDKTKKKKKRLSERDDDDEDHEFNIPHCKCAASKDYAKAEEILESNDLNWQAVYDKIAELL